MDTTADQHQHPLLGIVARICAELDKASTVNATFVPIPDKAPRCASCRPW